MMLTIRPTDIDQSKLNPEMKMLYVAYQDGTNWRPVESSDSPLNSPHIVKSFGWTTLTLDAVCMMWEMTYPDIAVPQVKFRLSPIDPAPIHKLVAIILTVTLMVCIVALWIKAPPLLITFVVGTGLGAAWRKWAVYVQQRRDHTLYYSVEGAHDGDSIFGAEK